jgi:hypothetical protein
MNAILDGELQTQLHLDSNATFGTSPELIYSSGPIFDGDHSIAMSKVDDGNAASMFINIDFLE